MKINYVEGDLFKAVLSDESKQPIIVAHVPLGRTWPNVKDAYHIWHANANGSSNFKLGETQIVNVKYDSPIILVANMVAQTLGGVRPLHYNHLACCMDTVARVAVEVGAKIVSPMFGSMLAGGNWLFIEQLIEDCWLRKNIPVTIHYLPGQTPDNWTPPNEQKTNQ